jgi:hypothetical protein
VPDRRTRLNLTLDELRLRAERFLAHSKAERFKAEAGLKTRPELEALYEADPLLDVAVAMPVVERALAEATGGPERRLRLLLEWLGTRHLERARSPLDDELYAWESTTTLDVGGSELPLAGILDLIRTADRESALELEERRDSELDEVTPLLVDRNYRVRQAAEELGYGPYVTASSRLAGFSLVDTANAARELLEETDDVFRAELAHQLQEWLGISPATAHRSDMRTLRRMTWLDDQFRPREVLETLTRDLAELGLSVQAEGRVTLDREVRPLKRARAFYMAIRVPDEVVISIAPVGGRAGSQGILRVVGGALHAAYTAPDLPFEYRCLGDSSVPRAFGRSFAWLTGSAPWVERNTGLSGEELAVYLRLANFVDLQAVRRDAATLIYELELAESDQPSELIERYSQLMRQATGVRYDARSFLDRAEGDFTSARRLRAWMLGAILTNELRERYDEDWLSNARAGSSLRELFALGAMEDASDLARRFGERLGPAPLVAAFAERRT